MNADYYIDRVGSVDYSQHLGQKVFVEDLNNRGQGRQERLNSEGLDWDGGSMSHTKNLQERNFNISPR